MKRKYSLDETVFEVIDTEEKAYWLGFILADGCITTKLNPNGKIYQYTVKIALKLEDINHLKKFQKFLKTSKEINIYKSDKYNYCELRIYSNKLALDLIKLGITPRKSFTVKFPIISKNLYSHLIRGIWDGDGSVDFKSRGKEYGSSRFEVCLVGNKNICKTVSQILNQECKCGIAKIHSLHSIFRIRKFNTKAEKVIKYLYNNSNIFLDRKYQVASLLFQKKVTNVI